MTLSFRKVMFSAQEVLDLIAEQIDGHPACDCSGLEDLEDDLIILAEERSRSETTGTFDVVFTYPGAPPIEVTAETHPEHEACRRALLPF